MYPIRPGPHLHGDGQLKLDCKMYQFNFTDITNLTKILQYNIQFWILGFGTWIWTWACQCVEAFVKNFIAMLTLN